MYAVRSRPIPACPQESSPRIGASSAWAARTGSNYSRQKAILPHGACVTQHMRGDRRCREGGTAMSRETDICTDGQTASFAATMAQICSRSASASRVVARRSRAISGCSRRTHCRLASGVSIHPNKRVCPQAVQSTERLTPVFCAVAPHTPSQGDLCVTASYRFCGTVMAETHR